MTAIPQLEESNPASADPTCKLGRCYSMLLPGQYARHYKMPPGAPRAAYRTLDTCQTCVKGPVSDFEANCRAVMDFGD